MKYSNDDIAVHLHKSYTQNIDYLSQEEYLFDNFNLFKGINNNDIRIANICWRRIYKNLHDLKESNPWVINWDKLSDITWLYGPKFDSEIQPIHMEINETAVNEDDEASDYSDDLFDNSDASSMSLIDSGYYADYSPSMDFEKIKKSNIKESVENNTTDKIIGCNIRTNNKSKKVAFDYKINQREIINGMIFDYDFLDENYL